MKEFYDDVECSIVLVGGDQDVVSDTKHLARRIVGYTSPYLRTDVPYEYLGDIREFKSLDSKVKLLVTVDDISLRTWLFRSFPESFFTYISPKATVDPDALVGPGVIIQKNCFISRGCVISPLVKINVGCQVHHDSTIDSCTVLAPGVVLLGHVKVGRASYVGARAVVKERVMVGDNSIIGMGSVVVNSVGDNKKAFGNPCRIRGGI